MNVVMGWITQISKEKKTANIAQCTVFSTIENLGRKFKKLTLTNNSKESRSWSLFSFTEWCLWNAAIRYGKKLPAGIFLPVEVEIGNRLSIIKTETKERSRSLCLFFREYTIKGLWHDRVFILRLILTDLDWSTGFSWWKKSKNSEVMAGSPIASHYIEVELKTGWIKGFHLSSWGMLKIKRMKVGVYKYNKQEKGKRDQLPGFTLLQSRFCPSDLRKILG